MHLKAVLFRFLAEYGDLCRCGFWLEQGMIDVLRDQLLVKGWVSFDVICCLSDGELDGLRIHDFPED